MGLNTSHQPSGLLDARNARGRTSPGWETRGSIHLSRPVRWPSLRHFPAQLTTRRHGATHRPTARCTIQHIRYTTQLGGDEPRETLGLRPLIRIFVALPATGTFHYPPPMDATGMRRPARCLDLPRWGGGGCLVQQYELYNSARFNLFTTR